MLNAKVESMISCTLSKSLDYINRNKYSFYKVLAKVLSKLVGMSEHEFVNHDYFRCIFTQLVKSSQVYFVYPFLKFLTNRNPQLLCSVAMRSTTIENTFHFMSPLNLVV